MANDLQILHAAVVAQLEADTNLTGVAVIPEDHGDLETEIETALAQLGICIVVGTLAAGVSNPNMPGPVFDALTFSCSVNENVTLNRTGEDFTDALSVAVLVAESLHHWRPTAPAQFANRTCLVEPKAIEYQQQGDLLAYDVNFNLGQ